MADKNKSPFLTTGERVRNFIGWAFVLSLLLHVVVAPLFPNLNSNEEEQQVEKVTVVKKIRVKVPTPPPPTPTPPPTPPPPPHPTQAPPQQPKLKINVVKTHNTSNEQNSTPTYVSPKTGTENGVPAGQGTASPGPTQGPPACKVPYADATTTDPVAPDYPEDAKELGIGNVTVQVQVTVGPTGELQAASNFRGSGNQSIDREALRAARESRYSPKIVNCEPVSGTYLFQADFTTE